MNTEEELLIDALLEVINWVKTDEASPVMAAEIVNFARAQLSFLFLFFVALATYGVRIFMKGYSYADKLNFADLKNCSIPTFGGLASILIGGTGLLLNIDALTKAWFAPRLYIIEILTETAIYG